MSGNEEIFNRIYKGKFIPDSIDYSEFISAKGKDADNNRKISGFCCPKKNECKVNESKEPIWSAFFGDEKTDLMVISEAPSGTGGMGLHIGGLFSDYEGTPSNSFYSFFQFIKETYNKNPYYTDVVKCGAAKQEKKGKVLEPRVNTCVYQFLLSEITASEPHTIICSGKKAYDLIRFHQQNSNNAILKKADIKHLLHFSSKAQLHLSPEDKKVIWLCQLGKQDPKEKRLSELSFIKNL